MRVIRQAGTSWAGLSAPTKTCTRGIATHTNGRRDAGPFLRDARADATLERAERSTERDNLGDTIDALLEAELQV